MRMILFIMALVTLIGLGTSSYTAAQNSAGSPVYRDNILASFQANDSLLNYNSLSPIR